jgi:S-adenosylmethionine uptake transporter
MAPAPSVLAGAGLGLAAFLAFVVYDVSVKLLGAGLPPLQIAFFATLFGAPLVLAQALVDRSGRGLRLALPGWMALRCAVVVVNGVLAVYAFAVLPLAQAYTIFFTMPLFIALLAVPILGERIDLIRGLAVLAGLAGVVIALEPGRAPLSPGHAAALAGAVIGAMNYIVIRRQGGVESTVAMMGWPMLAMLGATGAGLVVTGLQPMAPRDLALTAVMAGASFAGSLLVIAAYCRAPAIVVAPMQYSQILWAASLGALLFDETIRPAVWAGAALIAAAGVVIVARQDHRTGPA